MACILPASPFASPLGRCYSDASKSLMLLYFLRHLLQAASTTLMPLIFCDATLIFPFTTLILAQQQIDTAIHSVASIQRALIAHAPDGPVSQKRFTTAFDECQTRRISYIIAFCSGDATIGAFDDISRYCFDILRPLVPPWPTISWTLMTHITAFAEAKVRYILDASPILTTLIYAGEYMPPCRCRRFLYNGAIALFYSR